MPFVRTPRGPPTRDSGSRCDAKRSKGHARLMFHETGFLRGGGGGGGHAEIPTKTKRRQKRDTSDVSTTSKKKSNSKKIYIFCTVFDVFARCARCVSENSIFSLSTASVSKCRKTVGRGRSDSGRHGPRESKSRWLRNVAAEPYRNARRVTIRRRDSRRERCLSIDLGRALSVRGDGQLRTQW